jgi:hypothetical protein
MNVPAKVWRVIQTCGDLESAIYARKNVSTASTRR